MSDRIINLSPLHLDRGYFGTDLDGTFIRAAGKRFAVVPTLAAVFAREEAAWVQAICYLQKDIDKRAEGVSLFNLPAICDQA